jgi:hypothetical protein
VTPSHSRLDPESQRELSSELARTALERAAPEELIFFEDVAAEYFADPQKTLSTQRRDEPLGFGIELALLAPFALAVADYVVKLLGDLLADALSDAAKPSLAAALRRMIGQRDEGERLDDQDFTSGQRRRIHQAALAEAERLGLEKSSATLLANALIGALDVDST